MADMEVLVLDSTLNKVVAMANIDALFAVANFPARYQYVAFVGASVPGGQQATVNVGGPAGQSPFLNSMSWKPPGQVSAISVTGPLQTAYISRYGTGGYLS